MDFTHSQCVIDVIPRKFVSKGHEWNMAVLEGGSRHTIYDRGQFSTKTNTGCIRLPGSD